MQEAEPIQQQQQQQENGEETVAQGDEQNDVKPTVEEIVVAPEDANAFDSMFNFDQAQDEMPNEPQHDSTTANYLDVELSNFQAQWK